MSMFFGFRSLCMIQLTCRYCKPNNIIMRYFINSSSLKPYWFFIKCSSVPPEAYCMTMQSFSSYSNSSMNLFTKGWLHFLFDSNSLCNESLVWGVNINLIFSLKNLAAKIFCDFFSLILKTSAYEPAPRLFSVFRRI